MNSCICIGEITIDRYLDLGREYIGGISLNFAVNARRRGMERVALLSAVGADAGGRQALEKLAREGIDASRVMILPGATAHQDVRIVDGERFFPPGGYGAGVLAEFQLKDADLVMIARYDLLAVPVFRQIEHLAWAALHAPGFHGRRVADFLDGADLGDDLARLPDFLPLLDIAFLSGDEQSIARAEALARDSDTMLVVTLGAAGSMALLRGERWFQPALPVEQPVDSTGCGDAFQAAFSIAYLQGAPVDAALLSGAEQAAQVLRHYGATDDARI